MKATTPPIHFHPSSPDGPWGVNGIGRTWYVIHRVTLRAKAIGKVGGKRINYFDRALEEAHKRNKEQA